MKHTFISEIESWIPEPESYSDCFELIRSDSFRHGGRKKSMLSIFLESLSRPSIALSIWYRLSQHRGWAYPISRLMLHRFKKSRGIFLSPKTSIGYGLYIQHCFGIIINKTTVIGNNVNLGQLTTIGANEAQAAKIGDNVYIGPNCSLVDDVIIGKDSCIGAGAVVTRNVAPNTTVAGVPARQIATTNHPEYIRHPWKIDKNFAE